jgi:predicted CXXCH cytochrome family protein
MLALTIPAVPAAAPPGTARTAGPAPEAAAAGGAGVTSAPAPAVAPDRCAACHEQTGDDRLARPVRVYASDVHRAKGFGCVACHGGDANEAGMEAMDPKKGYIGVPDRRQVIQVCGRCHADARFMRQYNPALRVDQVAEYESSGHGRRLREHDDPAVATCASCHRPHDIRPPADPASSVHPLRVADTCGACHADADRMKGRRLPTDQLAKYRASVHWATMSAKGDLSAPTCNDCHGNHGAAPPGVRWVGNVCGQCHVVPAELFGKSRHADAFTQMGVPGCATCHDNHDIKPTTDAMVGLDEGAVCASCHQAADAGGTAAVGIRAALTALRTDVEGADAILRRAEHAGMEVSQARFDLNGGHDALVKARAAVHAASLDAVAREADGGRAIAARAHGRGVRALDELRYRRTGLGVSLAIVLVVIAGLIVKIRQVDRRQERGGEEALHG